jgi:hypothetical protein
MNFGTWIDTFIHEKGIDFDQVLIVEAVSGWKHHMPVSILIDVMKSAPESEQQSIKTKMVMIDVASGGQKPIMDFLVHLARCLT